MPFAEDALTCDAFLEGKLNVWQPRDGYRAATDPVLLAAACPAQPNETVLDIGCGVGTAALCIAYRSGASVSGLEVQPEYAELARRNGDENGIKMPVWDGDLTSMPADLRNKTFDHIVMNPPYYGSGTAPVDPGRATARLVDVGLSTWIDSGLRRLKPKGWLTVIQAIEWLPEIIVALNNRAGGIQIKPLASRASKPASRFILRARKGARSPTLLANPLILHEGDRHLTDGDSFTSELKSILRHAEPLHF